MRGQSTLLLFLAMSLMGCGKIRDTHACRAAAQAINPAFDEIEVMSKTPGIETHLRIAKRYEQLAARLGPLTPAEGSVSVALREYTTLIQATGASVRAHAEAAHAGQTSRVTEARRELDRIVRREKTAANRLAAECRS